MTAVRPTSQAHRAGPSTGLRCARCGASITAGRPCTACVVPRQRTAPPSTSGYVDPPTVPVHLPAPTTPARTAIGLWVLAAALAVVLAAGVLALVRPDLFGLPSASLFGGAGDPAPGSAALAAPRPG